MKNISSVILILFFTGINCFAQSKQPVDYVDPMIGTADSRWMLFPGITMPSGMVTLSPDNQNQGWKAGYEYSIENIAGFSHIHSWVMGGLLTTGLMLTMAFKTVNIKEQERAENPIITHMYTADPTARVWEDGRLYLYPSTDVAPPRGCDLMDGYHVFSTDDMLTWTDHGGIRNVIQTGDKSNEKNKPSVK